MPVTQAEGLRETSVVYGHPFITTSISMQRVIPTVTSSRSRKVRIVLCRLCSVSIAVFNLRLRKT